jgi:hypothetical protein
MIREAPAVRATPAAKSPDGPQPLINTDRPDTSSTKAA